MQHSWICWNKITGSNWEVFARGGGDSQFAMVLFKIIQNTISHTIFVISTTFFQVSTSMGVLFPTHYKKTYILITSKIAKNMTLSL